jgi:RNA-directed DNA polymerase
MMTKLLEIKKELRRRMHQSVPQQGAWLKQVIPCFLNYHAVPTNSAALSAFRYHVIALWLRALRRHSQKDRMTWARMEKLAGDWLPKPRIFPPCPSQRFAVKHRHGA